MIVIVNTSDGKSLHVHELAYTNVPTNYADRMKCVSYRHYASSFFVLGGKFPGVGMKEEGKCPTPGYIRFERKIPNHVEFPDHTSLNKQ